MAKGGNKEMAEGTKTKGTKKTVDIKDKNAKMAIVKNLMEKGKKNGTLTYKEIMDEIEHIDLGPEQIEKIYEVLESMGIEVLGDAPDHDVEEDEELDLTVPEGNR